MSDKKHDPAPWEFEILGKELDTVIIYDNEHRPIASLYHKKNDLKTMYANAELMTAAPVMLEALQKIAEMEPGTSCDTDDGCSYYTSECGNCDEMISTAKEALKECGVGK